MSSRERTADRVVIAAAKRKLEQRRQALAAERDQLTEIIDELEALAASCDDAVDGLGQAIESLSRYA